MCLAVAAALLDAATVPSTQATGVRPPPVEAVAEVDGPPWLPVPRVGACRETASVGARLAGDIAAEAVLAGAGAVGLH